MADNVLSVFPGPGKQCKPDAPGNASDASWCRPDYSGGGIANLIGSVIESLGPRRAPLATLALLPPERLGKRVALIVVDGLGYEALLAARGVDPLRRHLAGAITSVFPATTASAVTTLLTGVAPCRHGLSGWFTWLMEPGLVAMPLPFTERGGGALNRAGVRADRLYTQTPVTARLGVASWLVLPRALCRSAYTDAHRGPATVLGYERLGGLFARLRGVFERARGGAYVYAYWPRIDALAHAHGIASAAVRRALGSFATGFERLLEGLRGLDVTVLVSADHGFVDTTAATRLRLADHPELARCLARPLCGEPRAAYCYLRRGARVRFLEYLGERLPGVCEAVSGERLIDEELFGPGVAHPDLRNRVGDQVLLMQGRYTLTDRVAGEQAGNPLVGMHGGMSRAEMLVPLIVAAP